MYGITTGVNIDKSPKVHMKHLPALLALKIVNEGAGEDILVADVEFRAPEQIVGDFTVNITGDKPSFSAVTASNNAKLTIDNGITISKYVAGESEGAGDGYAILYLAIKPFDATGKTLSVVINGSERKIDFSKLDKEVKFESGKVTTLRVPIIELGPTLESDGIGLTSTGVQGYEWKETKSGRWPNYTYTYTKGDPDNTHTTCDILTFSNAEKRTNVVINGETCPEAYVVGTTESAGNIIIKGWAKDMINALPVGFYASRLDDTATAMTIDYINVWLPEYNENKQTDQTEYYNLVTRKTLDEGYGTLASLLGWDFENGISRDLIVNTLGVSAGTITFNGIVSNGYFDNNNIVVLDENTAYKEVSEAKVEAYIKKFGSSATLAGLRDILNAEFTGETINWSDAAIATGQAIYNKIYGILSSKAGSLTDIAMGIIGFPDYEALMYKVRDMKFEICVKTYPYATSYGTTDPTGPLAPIVFWGLDATTKDDKAAASTTGTEE